MDHIYVLCVRCQRRLPESLLKKTSNVVAQNSDKCLGMQRSPPGHFARVTAAHRLAVTHAKENAYKSILILEEDAAFDAADTIHFDFSSISQLIHNETKDWDVIRIGWKNRRGELTKKACRKECACNAWVERNMCTIGSKNGGCPLLSTSGYIMSAKVYDRFLAGGQSEVIDTYINRFRNTIVTPPMVHQPAYSYSNEKIGDRPFAEMCKQ